MALSDRQNWTLSGLVGVLLVANGIARLPGWSSPFDLLLSGALITGGGLAAFNAYRGIRRPETMSERPWTTRKTLINVVALVLLSLILAAAV